MALCIVRAGRHGEQEQAALKNNVVTVGWNALPDLTNVETRENLRALYEKAYPTEKKPEIANKVGQAWAFAKKIQTKDLVALPMKLQSAIAIGEVTGPYSYRTDISPDVRHTHPVHWIKTDFPRTIFDQDLLYSFGAYMTVCQITRNNAEMRVQALAQGKKPVELTGEPVEEETHRDLEQLGRDQVQELISKRFKGHELARLVEAVLQAQGYKTERSPPGPDGGVDILAGKGPFAFDAPRVCVQVKSGDSPLDVREIRELQATVGNFGGDQGLLVSWGGYRRGVLEEAKRSFFTLRLWDSGNLIEAILENYERLPEDLRAELPLKRIWSRVWEED